MNNNNFNCPPLMSDNGRMFTDYRQSTDIIDKIKSQNNIYSNTELKDFLMHNGTSLRTKYSDFYNHQLSCTPNHPGDQNASVCKLT